MPKYQPGERGARSMIDAREAYSAWLLHAVTVVLILLGIAIPTTTAQAHTVSFIARRDFAAGTAPFSVAVGDFNGDGVQDLAVANFNSNNVSVLLGNGDGTFQAAVNFGVGNFPASVA